MKRLLIGATLAAVAMFFWGFLYWALFPLPWKLIGPVPDELAMGQALDELLPASGAYVLPHPVASGEEESLRRTQAGPIATILYRKAGRSPTDPTIFLGGFLHGWIAALGMGLLLRCIRPGSYARAVGLLAGIGLVAAIWANLGRPIWYAQPWEYHVLIAVYELGGWFVAGLVLAKFARD